MKRTFNLMLLDAICSPFEEHFYFAIGADVRQEMQPIHDRMRESLRSISSAIFYTVDLEYKSPGGHHWGGQWHHDA